MVKSAWGRRGGRRASKLLRMTQDMHVARGSGQCQWVPPARLLSTRINHKRRGGVAVAQAGAFRAFGAVGTAHDTPPLARRDPSSVVPYPSARSLGSTLESHLASQHKTRLSPRDPKARRDLRRNGIRERLLFVRNASLHFTLVSRTAAVPHLTTHGLPMLTVTHNPCIIIEDECLSDRQM